MEWKMEQKMEKLYPTLINLMICFFFFPVSFTFARKVQQCLVTGSKWNIFVTDAELKSGITEGWIGLVNGMENGTENGLLL